jgi:CubicO group peptidase (beta-lactamase class C family)
MRITIGNATVTAVSLVLLFSGLHAQEEQDNAPATLEDKLSELAPDVAFENQWEDTDPVRLVHLLEHTTGWDDIHLPDYAHSVYPPVSLKEALDFHPHSRVSRWKPGTRSSYCNSGPGVAAYIVERVTGQEYEHISMRPSGSINASPRDMAKFLQFYINRGAVDGEQLISQESLARMETVQSTNAARVGQEAGYGLSNYATSSGTM